ncbi:Beta-galactosidase/beta-glucuronidase [Chitinophaga costaii]|uniref:Beta-galactosidase/beta-glucuronidase n=1 Tax=Chitinophaga costaii TaxID=1335309 RepID=A0A1C4AWB9_9BACT|nr:discoidin domain-containing protein [Chitinophaga costaii]PUZ26771.1 beta-mannosidase [Chitinophaga costaii]SCB98892.1 Beta-galactosidase/beta-glucuronidase [Chitinophaga costaii]
MFGKNGKWWASLLILASLQAAAQQPYMRLNSGSAAVQWKVKAAAAVPDSAAIFATAYNDKEWVPASVPGTVFGAFVEAKLEKDPNFGDNIYKVNKAKYDRDYWYRAVFTPAASPHAEMQWLIFEGVNRKGEVFLNGQRLGLLDGFMERGKFDVSKLLRAGQPNVLAVRVQWPGTPIVNYASPTYISSASWDWMPYVPGLNMGITDDVYLGSTGAVTITDPWVRTQLPDTAHAKLHISMELNNNSGQQQDGTVSGLITPGNIRFSRTVKIGAGQTENVSFQADIDHPQLWWPNGYGSQPLYACTLQYTAANQVSDEKKVSFGIKQYRYDTLGGVLHVLVNGQPVFIKGGNWGMSEYMLRCRGGEYETKVKLHHDMHLNMIRNWIGSITDDEFYEACDKYGMMVWDDFWLNSHPNLPSDVYAFNKNAVEKIKRLRNHPSIALWCGENEGYPLPPLNGWLREDVATYDGNDRLYQANSHADGLSGSGPWTSFPPAWYFTRFPGGFGGTLGWGMRSEIGTAVFTNVESFKRFMPDTSWWPRNKMWDLHFFGPSAANAGPDRYDKAIRTNYGAPTSIEDYCRKAQLQNMESNKAMYEGWLHHIGNDASGIMTWMSQSAYPSLVWQTYDYYYDLTGAYWGVKAACEPLHIQWSAADNSVKVVNTTGHHAQGLTAQAAVYNLDGKPAKEFAKTTVLDAPANNATPCFDLNFNIDNLAFHKPAVASSTAHDGDSASAVADGSTGSRWSSQYTDHEWVYVDLGQDQPISTVVLNWETAYAKAYSVQVSADAQTWKEVYHTTNGQGGMETIDFTPVKARYVRMEGSKRATEWGFSLYDFEVYGQRNKRSISDVQFIRLLLKDKDQQTVSENFYWRSSRMTDYTALNKLAPVQLKVSTRTEAHGDSIRVIAVIKNPAATPAFAVRVNLVRSDNHEQILPAMMNDNYFTLLGGEQKTISIDFERKLLPGGKYSLTAIPYNNK